MDKLHSLRNTLRGMGSVLVAYSGGLDSTFLLTVARRALGDRVEAATARSATFPKEELAFSRKMGRALKVRHHIIKTRELGDPRFAANPPERCYFCKKELFTRLKTLARARGLRYVIDASSVSDRGDFRPGARARRLLGIRSPLEEAGFTKDDIRRCSKRLGISTWDKPALACLASRIPYGTAITPALLARIGRTESVLKRIGLRQVRLRHHGTLCRIEVLEKEIPLLIQRRRAISACLKRAGWTYATVDLEGYRTGSMNLTLRRGKGSAQRLEEKR